MWPIKRQISMTRKVNTKQLVLHQKREIRLANFYAGLNLLTLTDIFTLIEDNILSGLQEQAIGQPTVDGDQTTFWLVHILWLKLMTASYTIKFWVAIIAQLSLKFQCKQINKALKQPKLNWSQKKKLKFNRSFLKVFNLKPL